MNIRSDAPPSDIDINDYFDVPNLIKILEYADLTYNVEHKKQHLDIAQLIKTTSCIKGGNPKNAGKIEKLIKELSNLILVSLEHQSEDVRNDAEMVFDIIKRDPSEMQYAGNKLKDSEVFISKAVKVHACVFEHASEKLRKSREVVRRVIQLAPSAFLYASPELREDKNLVFEESLKKVEIFKYAGFGLKSHKGFVAKMILENARHYEAISDELKNDDLLIQRLIQLNPEVLSYVKAH